MWIPTIERESCQGIREIAVQTRLLGKRKIFLNGSIDSEKAGEIVMLLMHLAGESDDPIDIYINSPGGEVNSGLLIYDAIQSIESPVNMYCTGMAASMAAVILAGGQKGRRFILPHSKTMIHEPLISGGVGGSATSIKSISDSILETRRITNGILAKHTGKTVEEIDAVTAHDHYMNAAESVAFGICDEVRDKFF